MATKYIIGNETFVNPYHFVSLDGGCNRERNYKKIKKDEKTLTGWIECELETLTPIFIPNSSNDNAFKKFKKLAGDEAKSYDFFSYEDIKNQNRIDKYSTPVIPGSEIKGMIRSAFEAVTNSCLSTIEEEKVLYKRTTQPGNPGRLIFDINSKKWKIEKCKKYMLKIYVCDYDPNFISSVNVDKKLWNILSNFHYIENGKRKRYFYKTTDRHIGREVYKIDRKFKEINRKISLFSGKVVKLCYHTKMTNKEKQRLLQLSTDKEYVRAIEDLYLQSQKFHTLEDFREGQEIWFKVEGKYKGRHYMPEVIFEISFGKKKEKNGWHKGFIHLGEYIENKHHEYVFAPEGEFIDIPEDETVVQNLLENIKLYRDEAVNIHKRKKEHTGYKHLGEIKSIEDLNGALIYYTERNGKYYLSPAAIGREVFYNKLQDVIKVKGYEPCDDIKNLCPACALFGMVKGKKAVASRVRFTDAFPEKKQNLSDYYDDVVILSELASPKLSATEFYLKKPDDAHLWNYDYAGKWEIKNGKIISRFIPFDNYQPQIRGRKFYWHQNINKAPGIKLTEADNRREEFSDRNVAIRPLKKGIKFSFRVYFNDIIEDELRKLMWMLEISGNKVHAHKIGMGKPIGLGSVQISVKGAKIRRIMLKDNTIEYKFENKFENFEDRLNVNEQNCQNTLGCSQKVFKEFMTITNFKKAPENISYPKNENQEKNYYWFVANRQVKIATATCPIIYQSLPLIDRPELKKYKIKTFKSVFSH